MALRICLHPRASTLLVLLLAIVHGLSLPGRAENIEAIVRAFQQRRYAAVGQYYNGGSTVPQNPADGSMSPSVYLSALDIMRDEIAGSGWAHMYLPELPDPAGSSTASWVQISVWKNAQMTSAEWSAMRRTSKQDWVTKRLKEMRWLIRPYTRTKQSKTYTQHYTTEYRGPWAAGFAAAPWTSASSGDFFQAQIAKISGGSTAFGVKGVQSRMILNPQCLLVTPRPGRVRFYDSPNATANSSTFSGPLSTLFVSQKLDGNYLGAFCNGKWYPVSVTYEAGVGFVCQPGDPSGLFKDLLGVKGTLRVTTVAWDGADVTYSSPPWYIYRPWLETYAPRAWMMVAPDFADFATSDAELEMNTSCCACRLAQTNVKSVHAAVPLGRNAPAETTDSLELHTEYLTPEVFKGRLWRLAAPAGVMKVNAAKDPVQAQTPWVVGVFEPFGSQGHTIKLYDRTGWTLNGSTGLLEPPAGTVTPYSIITVTNPDSPATQPPPPPPPDLAHPWPPLSATRLDFSETISGHTTTTNYERSPTTGEWIMKKHGGLRTKRTSLVDDPDTTGNPGGKIRTETTTAGPGVSDPVVSSRAEKLKWHAFGYRPIQVTEGTGTNTLVTNYTWVTAAAGYGKILSQVNPSGSWVRFEYTPDGRVKKEIRPWQDAAITAPEANCVVTEYTYDQPWPGSSDAAESLTTIVTKTLGAETARSYRYEKQEAARRILKDIVCTVTGAAATATTNLVTTRSYFHWDSNTSQSLRGALEYEKRPDGTATFHSYTWTPSGNARKDAEFITTVTSTGSLNGAGTGITDGTRHESTINVRGVETATLTTAIVSGSTGATLDSMQVTAWDADQPAGKQWFDGTSETMTYDCCGLSSRTDRQGIVTHYTRDEIVSRVPAEGGAAVNGLESSTWQTVGYHDSGGAAQSGDLEHIQREEGLTSRTFRKGADGTLIETGRTVRDIIGRVLSSRDALGNVTTFAEAYVVQGSGAKHLVRTTTLPDGATRVEEYAQDGSLLSLTGTAVRGQRYEYGTDASGSWTKVILLLANGADSAEWSVSWTDLAGRVWKTQTSAGAITTRYFNTLGQLWKTVDPDGVTALSQYDARGRLTRTVLDVNRNDTVDLGGPDRISETLLTLGTHGSEDVQVTTTSVWDAGATPSEVAKSEVTTDGLQSWSTAAGLTSHTVRTLPAAGAWTETTTAPDNTQSVSTYAGGRLVASARKDTTGAVLTSTSYQYDAHGRIRAAADPLGALTVYSYNDDDTVSTVTTPDPDGAGPLGPQVTATTYTARGQTDVVMLPDGKTSNSDYLLTGEVQQVTGTAAPAVAYTYDHAGRVQTLTTQPGTGAAAVTTWNYESASGRLQSKVHAAGSGTESYTWTAGGRALTKTNARGTVTGYFYGSTTSGTVAGAGDLTDITYSDGLTPQITYAHDRLGRTLTATRGGITRTVSLTLHGQQESESWTNGPLDGLAVDPGYDALRRRDALAVTGPGGSVPATGYSYDALTGELSSITSGTTAAGYAYRSGTRQIESVTFAESSTVRLTQTRTYDNLHRLTGITSQNGAPLAASGYTLDVSGRRARTVLADGTWWKYTYDGHGQVTGAERRRVAGSAPDDSDPALPGQSFTYNYDGLGNRTSATQGGGVTASAALTYTPAASNQYTTLAHNRTGIATGSADPAASVTVNSAAAPREGPWWGQSETTAAGSTAAWLNFSIDATLGGNTDHTDTALLIPPSSLSPAYDADGNLTDDGLRTFTWDAESRLLSVTTKDTLLPAGAPMYRASYQYDDGGRRIAQTVEARTVSGGVYVLVSRRCYLYDAWNCVAEYDYAPAGAGATRTLYRTQVWGLDIGGARLPPSPLSSLLLVRRHTGPQAGTHCATHDGNGNVTALVNAATGPESARYDYDPFGNLLQATGSFAAENPYRFSTQHTDDITGLVYYGYRHYDPVHGRWLSRDPIGEAGGVNLYGMVGNDAVNNVDVLGLELVRVHTYLGITYVLNVSTGVSYIVGQGNRLIPAPLPNKPDPSGFFTGYRPPELNVFQRFALGAVQGGQTAGDAVCSFFKSAWATGDAGGMHLKALMDGDTGYTRERYENAVYWATYYGLIAKKLTESQSFREAVWNEMGPDLKQQFTTADGLSEVAANLGVAAFGTAGGVGAARQARRVTAFLDDLMRNPKLQKFFCSSCGVDVPKNGGYGAGTGSFTGNAPIIAGDLFRLARHGDMPSPRPGQQSHHGAMSAWMKKHFDGYDPNKAPAILMPEAAHRATFGVYQTWRAEMRRNMGGTFDWKNVSETEMRDLSERMFDAAQVPSALRQDYWHWFDRMKSALRN